MSALTQGELKNLLSYDPMTGDFTWLVKRGSVNIGDIAGTETWGVNNLRKYIQISINNRLYKAHRLAYLYMTGKLPKYTVDHDNGNSLDNSWVNLNDVPQAVNVKNQKLANTNTSGYTGINQLSSGRWRARINIKGVTTHLGTFSTLTLAITARQTANVLHGYHINHGKRKV